MSEEKAKTNTVSIEDEEEHKELVRVYKKIKKLPPKSEEDFEHYTYNELIFSNDDGVMKSDLELLEEAYDRCLPKFLRLRERNPPNSFITIGTTHDPRARCISYDDRDEYIKRTDVDPPIKLQEMVLYSSYSELGLGDLQKSSSQPKEVTKMAEMKIPQVAMGYSHTMLLVNTDDEKTKEKYDKLNQFVVD
ncbi:hypothetical protein PVAND_004790 [Polypedilum vanderplanki]|uniref:Uncharacterized protein n=1 Tax=Polypedilum vanderplanki TaxID=319348 RepID=A0A9J6BZ57_POLVA|nr:hypothetical protein PVAND_004790 [Polypedilum vanderplanki]